MTATTGLDNHIYRLQWLRIGRYIATATAIVATGRPET